MKTVFHRAQDRGYFDHGWLKTFHSFSFGHYYNPEKMRFGRLRVLNDDVVSPGRGFATHPHENMEIVSIPLAGELAHKDSAGHEHIIRANDVQVMSAGTGISHSEYNHSREENAAFLQVWVMPDIKGHAPRYDQRTFDVNDRHNRFQTLVSPDQDGLWLHQNAWFSRAAMSSGTRLDYAFHAKDNGIYIFVIKGDISIGELKIKTRDALGVWDVSQVSIGAETDTDILVIEIPL